MSTPRRKFKSAWFVLVATVLLAMQLSQVEGQTGTAQTNPTANVPGSVSGTLRFTPRGMPIAGVSVSLDLVGASAFEPNASFTVTTGADGSFVFPAIPPGEYSFWTRAPGDIRPDQGGGPRKISIAPGQQIRDVEVVRLQAGIITGRILSASGSPVVDARVEALSVAYRAGRPLLSSGGIDVGGGRTNDRGEYRLAVAPGEYILRARGGTVIGQSSTVFYPRITKLDDAEPVRVMAGEEITGVNFFIPNSATARTVSGHVIVPDAAPAGQARLIQVTLVPSNGPADVVMKNAFANADGLFEMTAVDPGAYDSYTTVAVRPAITPGVRPLNIDDTLGTVKTYGRVPIVVAEADLRDITITPQEPTVVVNGKISVTGTPLTSMTNLWVDLVTEELPLFLLRQASQRVRPDGTFTLPAVPQARYYLKIYGFTGGYISDVLVGGTSVLSRGITVRPNLGSVEVVLQAGGGVVSGIVRDADQQPVPYTSVVLVPSAEHRWNLELQKTATSDAKGLFTFQGIAPGSYKAFAWEKSFAMLKDGTSELPGSFVAEFEDFGTPVDVTGDGTSDGVVVRLIPRKR